MGGLGAGLLGFAQGALGGAEQYIQEEREHERKFSLEDYRLEKEKELAEFKAEIEGIADAHQYARTVGEQIRQEGVVSAEKTAELESQERRAKMAADATGSASRATEASLKRSWTSGASAINSAFGEALKDANANVHDEYALPKDPQEYLAVLEEIGTPQAQTYIELIHEYLDNVDVWDRADLADWKDDLRAAAKVETPDVGGRGIELRVVGKRKG